ncbi:MAG: DUF4012 domain-containing protein [Candidatus Falkowbacteria bacterium]
MLKPTLKTGWRLLKYTLAIIVGFFVLILILLSNKLTDSQKYYSQMVSGKTKLEAAINSAKTQKYSQAQQQASEATYQFNAALSTLSDIRNNKVAAYFSPITASVNDLEYLTQTAEVLGKSIERSTAVLAKLDQISGGRFTGTFSDLSTADRQQILATIYESAPELNGLKANLELSLDNLNKIHRIGILLPINSQLTNIKNQLATATNLLNQVVPLTQLLPSLSGYPQESQFLVLLQNNDELRPTGGFIGTYGLMNVKDGKAGSIITEDVYHLDMPCIGKLTQVPPEPIKKYMKVDYWWLRDANFSPDFPTSAKQVEAMFMAESACALKPTAKPTAIIAINPDLIVDLLGLVGPITIDGTTYDRNNFQPLLQYNVEVGYVDKNITSWNRKDIINSVVSELEKRLMSLPTKRWPEILNVIQENIAKRNLQIYFDNNEQEGVARSLNLTGEIKNSNNDYLMVVDANLAAFKSDSVMRKNITYKLSQDNSPTRITAEVKLSYSHEGGFDWRTTRYRSYTRIYAPLGSKLLDSGDLEDFSATDDTALNKTVFGFFWTIEPGQTKTASVKYSLPEYIKTDNYNLYFQKQSGSRLNNFQLDKAFKPKNTNIWSGTLDRDKIFN